MNKRIGNFFKRRKNNDKTVQNCINCLKYNKILQIVKKKVENCEKIVKSTEN